MPTDAVEAAWQKVEKEAKDEFLCGELRSRVARSACFDRSYSMRERPEGAKAPWERSRVTSSLRSVLQMRVLGHDRG